MIAGLWKAIIGANLLGFEPYILINTIRRKKSVKQKVMNYFNVDQKELDNELDIIEKELGNLLIQYMTTQRMSPKTLSKYRRLARHLFVNKRVLDEQPDYVRWRFK